MKALTPSILLLAHQVTHQVTEKRQILVAFRP